MRFSKYHALQPQNITHYKLKISRTASSFVDKVLYFLRVLSGKSPSSFLRCLYVAATPWTAAYTSLTLLWSHRNVRYSLALTFSCFSLTFKCLRNRLVGFFDSSLAKAGTFRSRQGVFFSKVVKNTHIHVNLT